MSEDEWITVNEDVRFSADDEPEGETPTRRKLRELVSGREASEPKHDAEGKDTPTP